MPAALFTAAIDALFADRHLALDAIYRAGGADPGVLVRVIVRRPDRVGESTVYIIQGEPIRDAERLVWTIEARPA